MSGGALDQANDPRNVVFVEATMRRSLLGAGIEYRPPVARGDLVALIRHAGESSDRRPLRVGVIDGTRSGPQLGPKEVVSAIGAGVQMFGAAGDGALRAAECSVFGMVGVGQIFKDAAAELVSTLDEYWAPPPVSELDQSLASWRVALREAVADARLAHKDVHAFVTVARSLPWSQRTVDMITAAASGGPLAISVRRAMATAVEGQRHAAREDARAMIEAMLSQGASRSNEGDEEE